MIRHTVVFRLKHKSGSQEEASFLAAAKTLATIPGVRKFEVLQQISPMSQFKFGLSMEFSGQPAYDGYNIHPLHVAFVQGRWKPEVEDYLEIDYIPVHSARG